LYASEDAAQRGRDGNAATHYVLHPVTGDGGADVRAVDPFGCVLARKGRASADDSGEGIASGEQVQRAGAVDCGPAGSAPRLNVRGPAREDDRGLSVWPLDTERV
jgi:hypothetical protein